MAKFLALQIRLGRITADDVPVAYRDAVEAELGNQLNQLQTKRIHQEGMI